jgi:exopolyphosphatase/guanosine-5'-triphosphate,3'-diphosphate pyrophosphatase
MGNLFGVVDIGSNALRWSIGEPNLTRGFSIVSRGRAPLRLGEEVFLGDGAIPPEKIKALIHALKEFIDETNRFKVKASRIVATSAMREATNQYEVLLQIEAATGISVEVIQGIEEARLVQVAIAHEISLNGILSLLVDIGGGSVEVSLCDGGQILSSHSVKVGGVRLLSLLNGRTGQTPEEESRAVRLVERVIRQFTTRHIGVIISELHGRAITCLIGTGGSLESLGQLKVSLLGNHTSSEISSEELTILKHKILKSPLVERINKLQLRKDRADVIVPAVIMVDNLVQSLQIDKVLLPKIGLREGVLFELARNTRETLVFHVSTSQLRIFAVELGRRYHFNESHGTTVAKLAGKLYDLLVDHTMLTKNEEDRTILELAGILHDIGYCVHADGHHKHSQYLIAASPFFGLSEQQKSLISLIARYHRKAKPSQKHVEFRSLSETNKERVRTLSSILRIADACDRDHESKIQDLKLDKNGELVTLQLFSSLDTGIEEWAIHRKKSLFEEVFGVSLNVQTIA